VSREISLPLSPDEARALRAGDEVELTGEVITGRDQACARLFQLVETGKPLPVGLAGELIYFVGPTPARPGEIIGSAGPTTSARMNPFLPKFIELGLRGMIGKGYISSEVKSALEKQGAVYFGAIGGTGALLSQCIESAQVLAFPELVSEAVHRLRLRRFPVIVLHDTVGGDVYEKAHPSSA
jgi:fumarate hydratase subunit beta